VSIGTYSGAYAYSGALTFKSFSGQWQTLDQAGLSSAPASANQLRASKSGVIELHFGDIL